MKTRTDIETEAYPNADGGTDNRVGLILEVVLDIRDAIMELNAEE
jgi:hypothetical protein